MKNYYCTVVFGSQARIEVEQMKENLSNFLKSFNYPEKEIKKIYKGKTPIDKNNFCFHLHILCSKNLPYFFGFHTLCVIT